MCGIVGLFNTDHPASTLHAMSDLVRHRGPDAAGSFIASDTLPRVLLGHRRLTIIDLSEAANQPFRKHGLVLVYNGEIYNFKELRPELQAHGAAFRTDSDTEVVLEAWLHWGPDCLRRLRGMFAFALYDSRSGRLFLARDPFGIKPLFYARDGKGVAFASELKALRPALSSDQQRLDATALVASLLYSWIPESHCILRGAEKLPPGCFAQFDSGGVHSIVHYWDPVDEIAHAMSEPTDSDELAATLEDSVRAHLISDVPVATFLSGGLDSSLITVIAARYAPEIESYTISFRDEDRKFEAMPDDLRYASRVASRHGIKLNRIEVAPEVAGLLPRMARAMDEPIGDAAALNAYMICDAARQRGVKVLLSGMGADEIFAGYRKHAASLLASRYRDIPAVLRKRLIEPVVDALPVATTRRGLRTVRWAKRFVSFAGLPEIEAFHCSYTHYGDDEMGALISPDLAGAHAQLLREHAGIYSSCPSDDPVTRMCFTDLNLFLPGLNLAYTDRASMAASTEVRVPFVDREVVRAAFSIPGSDKIERLGGKMALKKAAERYLENEIVYRPKALFSVPLRAWIRRDLRTMVDDLLLKGRLAASGMVNTGYLRSMVELDRSGAHDYSKQIWHLMTLEHWLRDHENWASDVGTASQRHG